MKSDTDSPLRWGDAGGLIRDGQYNIGHICTRQQCDFGRAAQVAMRYISPDWNCLDFTFRDLEDQSNRFANVLNGLGFSAGDRVFTFLPKTPELYVCLLGALKARCIAGTLFSNFGEEALLDRLGDAGAGCLLTKRSFLKKINRIRARLPRLRAIILADDGDEDPAAGTFSLRRLMQAASDWFDTPRTAPDTPSLLHYTSGSTGKPKGVLHAHRSVLLQNRTAVETLCLNPGERFWCTADPGWVTGTSYGMIGPWSAGVSQVHFGGAYDAADWFRVLEQEGVTVWYTAPTALRMLMREEESLYRRYRLDRLKHVFSVGEPLNPEVILWARRVWGRDVYDTWFQTETGAIMIANRPGMEVRPGSMGRPVPGVEAAILSGAGEAVPDGEQGNLCLRAGWPSMFVAYLNHDDAYRRKFRGDHYETGDTAYRDEEGYFWFLGRSDDVINTAGHLVSPFEVESSILELPEVAESAAVGVPDPILFEKVAAFVCLRAGVPPSRELELKIRLHVSNKVSSVAAPQDLRFVESIPKTKSGKIMRRVLRAVYLGADAGDISTMDGEP